MGVKPKKARCYFGRHLPAAREYSTGPLMEWVDKCPRCDKCLDAKATALGEASEEYFYRDFTENSSPFGPPKRVSKKDWDRTRRIVDQVKREAIQEPFIVVPA